MSEKKSELDLNFLQENFSTNRKKFNPKHFDKPKKKRKRGRGMIIIIALIIFLFSATLYIKVSASPLGTELKKISWIQTIKHLITGKEKQIKGEKNDRINILLLGMGGKGHDGAYLTDTIIVSSIKPSTKQISMVSIPRDLYVQIDGYGWKKINHANAYGEINGKKNDGVILATKIIEQVTGQNIPYWIRIDFNGFKKIIDDLGGVDIYIEKGFTDNQYPDYNHKTKTITFHKGQQHLNGEQALAYARSRHGNNGQGSDFSRSSRQMQILLALKDKVISSKTLFNPNKLSNLYNNLIDNIDTNIKLWEAIKFANIIKDVRQSNIINKVLSNGPHGLLRSYISSSGAYVLTTKINDFSQIHELFSEIFNNEKVKKEKANIIIYNGTKITGLAAQSANKLNKEQFNIIAIGNTPTQNWEKTIIYKINKTNKLYSLQKLKNNFSQFVSNSLPFTLQEKIILDNDNIDNLHNIDFIIVLGVN